MRLSAKKKLTVPILARWLLCSCLALLTGFSAPQTQALTTNITAVFNPDPANPQVNQFKNTTPNSGICATYPGTCIPRGYFSIGFGGFQAISQTPILANHANVRDGAMFKVPAEPRPVQVVSASGQVAEVFFSISALSATIRTRDARLIIGMPTAEHNYAHSLLWGGRPWGWNSPVACPRGAGMYAGTTFSNFFWFTPQPVSCGFPPAYEIDWLKFDNISVSYLMTAPDPLRMETGTYSCSITYTAGPGEDFDFGDNLLPTDNSVTFNFSLEVQHTLRFQFPANSLRVVLNPAGGWQQWLNQGRRPQRLFADQGFSLSSSTPFSMTLQCEYLMGTQCGIRNPAGHLVAVETRLTLPNGLRDASDSPVERQQLSTTPAVYSPSFYVDNGQAKLHFEIPRDPMQSMLDAHSGSTYRGTITVVSDSEIDF
jgi:hypothetical protein